LREGDELIDVVITEEGDDVMLATASGMAIRFSESDARPMGRNTSGVKGIGLRKGDHLVGMVVAEPEATLLTVCANGYGKRTPFGVGTSGTDEEEGGEEEVSSQRYRLQRRGGKGVRDIKTTKRNGPVIGIVRVNDDDELLMISARGKIQRIRAIDISVIGRNTQGVRIMKLDDSDTLTAVVRVPAEETEADSDSSKRADNLGDESGATQESTLNDPVKDSGTDEVNIDESASDDIDADNTSGNDIDGDNTDENSRPSEPT